MPAYSFQQVTATLVGLPTFNINLGYGAAVADEGITTAMADDKNTMLTGADGEGMHSLHAGKAGQITVRLLKTSPTNQALNLAYTAQALDPSLWGQNVITIRNTASGDITVGRECAFKKLPDFTNAKDGTIQEWVFDCIKIDTLLGTF